MRAAAPAIAWGLTGSPSHRSDEAAARFGLELGRIGTGYNNLTGSYLITERGGFVKNGVKWLVSTPAIDICRSLLIQGPTMEVSRFALNSSFHLILRPVLMSLNSLRGSDLTCP